MTVRDWVRESGWGVVIAVVGAVFLLTAGWVLTSAFDELSEQTSETRATRVAEIAALQGQVNDLHDQLREATAVIAGLRSNVAALRRQIEREGGEPVVSPRRRERSEPKRSEPDDEPEPSPGEPPPDPEPSDEPSEEPTCVADVCLPPLPVPGVSDVPVSGWVAACSRRCG